MVTRLALEFIDSGALPSELGYTHTFFFLEGGTGERGRALPPRGARFGGGGRTSSDSPAFLPFFAGAATLEPPFMAFLIFAMAAAARWGGRWSKGRAAARAVAA